MPDRSRAANARASSCHWLVSRVIVVAESPAPEPRNCSRAGGVKSLVDSPCRYSSGSTSLICGDLRAQAGRIAEENRFRSPVSGVDAFVVDSRCFHLNCPPGCRQHLAGLVIAVADHQPMPPLLIELIGELGHVGGDLSFNAAASI